MTPKGWRFSILRQLGALLPQAIHASDCLSRSLAPGRTDNEEAGVVYREHRGYRGLEATSQVGKTVSGCVPMLVFL